MGGPIAQNISGTVTSGLVSTGSTSQANSLAIFDTVNVVTTTGANTGVRLPADWVAGDSMVIQNNGASTLFVYPQVGGNINAGSTDAKVDVATLKGALLTNINGLSWSMIVGA